MRDCRLQGVQAVVQRQQSMPAKRDNDRLFLDRQDRRPWLFRYCLLILDRRPAFPFGDGLLVDPKPQSQRPQALLTMLYRSTALRTLDFWALATRVRSGIGLPCGFLR